MSDQKMRTLFQELMNEIQFTLQALCCPLPLFLDKADKRNSYSSWYDLILTRYR